jgi:hypothetical protein
VPSSVVLSQFPSIHFKLESSTDLSLLHAWNKKIELQIKDAFKSWVFMAYNVPQK